MIVSLSSEAIAVLIALAAERDESPEALAENAIEEACLDERRRRGFKWPDGFAEVPA